MWDVADSTVFVQLHTITHARQSSKTTADNTMSIQQQSVTGDKEPYEGTPLACMRHMMKSQQQSVKGRKQQGGQRTSTSSGCASLISYSPEGRPSQTCGGTLRSAHAVQSDGCAE